MMLEIGSMISVVIAGWLYVKVISKIADELS